jgi:uncharacterized protein (DUF433 family)
MPRIQGVKGEAIVIYKTLECRMRSYFSKGGLQMQKIVIDEDIRHGKPVIKGTRVPIDIILGSLAGGMSYQEVCEDYEITEDDIRAAIEYASKLVANEEIHIVEAA